MDPSSERTLRKIESYEPAWTRLQVGGRRDLASSDTLHIYLDASAEVFERIGSAIGSNRCIIRDLEFDGGVAAAITNNASFLGGLKLNASILKIELIGCNLSGVAACGLFGVLGEDDSNLTRNLTDLFLDGCILNRGGMRALASTLRRCTNLNELKLICCQFPPDGEVRDLVPIIRECRHMHTLEINGGGDRMIGPVGCDALVTLLQDTNNNLEHLFLGIQFFYINALASALASNNKLEGLYLYCDGESGAEIYRIGWSAFSRTLCNTSSINATYSSNHTLKVIGGYLSGTIPDGVSSLLDMNSSGNDKKEIAIKKILSYHPRFDMEPFFEWDEKMVPVVVNWFDRARACTGVDAANIDRRKLDSIYQFIHAMPEVFELPTLTNLSLREE